MKLNFFSTNSYSGMLNLPVNIIKPDDNSFYKLGRTDDTLSPPVPFKILKSIPENAKILYDIFSLDCLVNENGGIHTEKISETEALSRASGRKIYNDSYSSSAYFRYTDNLGQHTVWIEDTYHTVKKIKVLEKSGFNEIGVLINHISADTIVNLIHADCCSI